MVLTLVGIVVLAVILVNLTPVQNFLARQATQMLSRKLKTKVSIRHVRIDFLNHLLIQGLYIEDHAHDTLLYAGEARVRITDWFILKHDKPVISYVGLRDAYGHLYRTTKSREWNYQFVIDAFDTGAPKKPKDTTSAEFELDLKKLDLQRVRFHMDDAWVGNDYDFDIGSFQLAARELDLKKKLIDISSIDVERAHIIMKDYVGGRPASARPKAKAPVIDTTAFNPDHWIVKVSRLDLQDCLYSLTSSTKPAPRAEFDPEHLLVSGIDISAGNIRINGDTLTGHVSEMSAKERCGLAIREMEADVKVSPRISELSNLLLKTDKSTLGNYYAMHYERFPDFLDYITKVKMEASLDKAIISGDEVSYFAPMLKQYHTTIKASGKFYGSVDSLTGTRMDVSDGTSSIKGDLAMIGLPDIDRTYIRYQNGAIATSGEAIMHYAPMLRNDPNVDLARLSFINFKGGFTGFISNFAVNGVLNTNLGSVTSVANLKIPGLNTTKSAYSGTISAQRFNLGVLLRQPFIGSITFKADVSGNGLDENASGLKVDAFINEFWLYGHNYTRITAQGLLDRKKFDGKILVDDTSLALAFNGSADFNGPQPTIKATANLLKSDLQDLKLVDEPMSAVADFDLDMTGSNIDNFLGSAKLYNINLLRGTRRVDVDSVDLNATLVTNGKMLTLSSNDIVARITGTYELSQLPYSMQYFLAKYMPSYIKAPKHYAPDQDITFDVETRNIDSLLRVVTSMASGFDNSRISGSLNTTTQQLRLTAHVPEGRIADVRLTGITLNGDGNFTNMVLTGDAANVSIGDSLVNLSLNLNTSIGNDSIGFNITTSSSGAYGTATLNGGAVALGDSLLVVMRPSEVFLSDNRWEIPGGSRVVVGHNYLLIRDLFLNSGVQRIAIRSDKERASGSLLVNAENIDLAQLSNIAGFAGYEPDGRLKADVRVDGLFGDLNVDASVRATSLKLGVDTIGDVVLNGNYNAARQRLSLTEGSGVFLGDASLQASGVISFDSTSKQRLDGTINLINAPLKWTSPVLVGFVSNISGRANGSVKISGTAQVPDVDGSVSINDGVFRVDYLGTTYHIPDAKIGLTSDAIDLSSIKVYDSRNNVATLSGKITHDRFKKFRLNTRLSSPEFEVINLKDYENELFFGNLIAKADVTVRGPFDNISMNITASPADQSHLYLPISSGNSVGSYSYVAFKQYGASQTVSTTGDTKFSISIAANMNPKAEITMILDPATGDAINAKGTGNVRLEIPADGDIRMFGPFNIDEGDYTFTFRQLFFKRQFIINSGSKINFNGPIAQTTLDVNATYRTRASLYDLLSEDEKRNNFVPASELADTKRMQDINVLLHMKDRLQQPTLTFEVDLPEKRSVGTYAYTKLERINKNDRQLFDQVASLLLIGYFIPPEGIAGATAATGAINNMSEIISTTTSSQLTNIVNKLLGDPDLQIDLKYKNYNLSDGTTNNPLNRNEVKLGLRQNFLNDRLIVEVGTAYDWGRPTATNSSTSNFNLLNNFRIQYLLNKEGRLRLNGFRTSDYDVLLGDGRNVTRAGVGISWRKSFNTFSEFFHSEKYKQRKLIQLQQMNRNSSDTTLGRRILGTD